MASEANMPEEQDPFEVLKKKLEAKRKEGAGKPEAGKPKASEGEKPRAPEGRPVAPSPATPARPAPATTAKPAAPAAAKPQAPAAKPAGKPADPPSGGPERPRGFIKTAWTAEDLEGMHKVSQEVDTGPPKKYVSHRVDSGVARRLKGQPEKAPSPKNVPKPKGFNSGRFDR
jgi:hypothetical protein